MGFTHAQPILRGNEDMDSLNIQTSRPRHISSEEWAVRVDLAACYRLIAHFKWDDLILTHNSARAPGSTEHFLINPHGLMFDEITASNLIKIDFAGNRVEESEYEPNYAGFVIHSAIYMGRPDVECVIHTHTEADIAVGALEEGLLPLSQWAMRFYNRLGYHDYEGVSLDLDERERLQQSIGSHPVLVLRNHGLLATGRSCAAATSATRASGPKPAPRPSPPRKRGGLGRGEALSSRQSPLGRRPNLS